MFISLEPVDVGVDFSNKLLPEHEIKYLLNGAGVCTGDYDNDGLVDFYVLCQDGPNRLFRQDAPWHFQDVTTDAGNLEGGAHWGAGATFVDINNDGWLDLYVCNTDGPNMLFINDGRGRFTEQAERWGLDYEGPSIMAAFADYDNDGDLDLYLINNRVYALGDRTREIKVIDLPDGTRVVHPDFRHEAYFLNGRLQEAGHADILLRNDGDRFKDVTASSGIAGFDMGLSATWWDFNDDGWIDLYVGNDLKSPDHLYQNLGNGKFVDVIADAVGHTPWFSMGADAADLNNDGRLDLVNADMSSTTHYKQKTTMGEMGNSAWFLTMGRPRQFMRNTVFVNSGTSRFWEAANLTGLDSTDWTWSVKLNDYDCDGRVDAYFTNGVSKNMNDSDAQKEFEKLRAAGRDQEADEQILKMPALNERNLFFKNLGNLKFEDVSASWGADDFGTSHGCSVADFDNDGDLDMIVNHMNKPLGIYRNDCSDGNRILVRLIGTSSNRNGIGARITIQSGDSIQTRQLTLSRGYMSADAPLVHFGLGKTNEVDKLTVQWPSGIVQEFEDLDAGFLYTITEQGQPMVPSRSDSVPSTSWFADISDQSGITFKHNELPFDDFQYQPLLPNKLSQLGPGMAWGDVNGDGKFDCYICGARGQFGSLLVWNQEQNGFTNRQGPWTNRMANEEMSCLFLDFDSDGDQDLYIVSGGNEAPADSELLRDILYVNDGNGNFSEAASDVLPDMRISGSSVSASDFDCDGDLDLFIGARLIPRRWPLPTSSFLLRNDNGKFVDVTRELAPDLVDIGLVTGSIWSDADQDGWPDLLLTLEWGPVRLLRNHQGQLEDETSQAGLADDLGWWNSIAAGDVDNDGDMDYVAMNMGLNTKYHADKKHPVTLYAHDFDGNGQIDLVESEWEGDKCFPIRGKSCSTHAMPMVSEKFPTYHEFALAELSDIYGDDSLSQASKFTANNLASVLLINNGKAEFEIVELPRLAQISPGFGVALEDFDGDGNCDLIIAQNFLHPQPETGQMDGGMGLLLQGDGNGNFHPVGPKSSGFIIPEQGMGLAIMDLNDDLAPDFVVTTNDGSPKVYQNQFPKGTGRRITVRVDLGPGNPTGVGSQIRLKNSNRTSRTAEIHAGNGYLSQSPGELCFVVDEADPYDTVEVRLPDGSVIRRKITADTGQMMIAPNN